MKLALMVFREGPQHLMALCGNLQNYPAAVRRIMPTVDQTCIFTAFAQFDDTVMP